MGATVKCTYGRSDLWLRLHSTSLIRCITVEEGKGLRSWKGPLGDPMAMRR